MHEVGVADGLCDAARRMLSMGIFSIGTIAHVTNLSEDEILLLRSGVQQKQSQSVRKWIKYSLFVLMIVCVIYAFFSGADATGSWGANYYRLSFFEGFYRRALVGSILYPLGNLRFDDNFISCLKLFVTLMLTCLGFLKLFRLKEGYLWVYIYVCIFFLSYYGTLAFQMNALIEPTLYLFALVPFFLRNSVAKVALVAATVWVHEMAIFTCVPLYFAIEYICCGRKKVAFAALGVSLFSFCLIWGSFSTVDEETIRIYKQTIYDAGYKMGEDYFDVFRHTLHGSRLRWQTYYNNNLGWWNRGWDAIIFCFLMSATLAYGFYRASGAFFSASIIFVASLSPLLMGFVGWDVNRWIFLSWLNISVLSIALRNGIVPDMRHLFLCIALAGLCFSSVAPLGGIVYYRNFKQTMHAAIHFKDYVIKPECEIKLCNKDK